MFPLTCLDSWQLFFFIFYFLFFFYFLYFCQAYDWYYCTYCRSICLHRVMSRVLRSTLSRTTTSGSCETLSSTTPPRSMKCPWTVRQWEYISIYVTTELRRRNASVHIGMLQTGYAFYSLPFLSVVHSHMNLPELISQLKSLRTSPTADYWQNLTKGDSSLFFC